MKVLVTGGAGFVGSHVAEYYAKAGEDVIIADNLWRGKLLKKKIPNLDHNLKLLDKYKNVTAKNISITDAKKVEQVTKGCDVIIHTAAQTAVTTSMKHPRDDFTVNALGTFNVLEAARKNDVRTVVYASTNKVYGENVNKIGIRKGKKRYHFESKYRKGVPETFPTDLCEHTPYGCSKLAGDIYAQDYARNYGMRTGVFRMSCIYGTRQFGVEDQGWVAWFTIATALGKPLNIYGDGKQVRDLLYVTDLVNLYDKFVKSKLSHGVFNAGGGHENTLSLIELLDIIEDVTGKRSKVSFGDWRPSDQKVFIADISTAEKALRWKPKVSPREGVTKLAGWVNENKSLFSR
ncbi:MAG: NAD-dependent epimerase/dehydratase family protein [archaeon]